MSQIIINDLQVEIVRKKIKNLHLGVYPPDGRVRLAVPDQISDESIRLYLVGKLPWIRRRIAYFNEILRQSPREYVTGESHYFMGRRYLLDVVYKEAVPRVSFRNKTHIELSVRPDASFEKREEVMTEWYRAELKALLPELIEKWCEQMGVILNKWEVKRMKTKWGTCNAKAGRIWFNLELAKKPQRCIEYVIVHELAHLRFHKHDVHFREFLSLHLPNWEEIRKELNEFVI